MPGESITLECTVTSTTDPPNNITWKVDGQAINPDKKQKQETSEGVVDIQGHLTLKITEKMDDKTVTCEYSKDRFGDHIEAKLRVFTLKIETSEDVCNKCEGNLKLVFKESVQESPAELTVDKRIKEKIKELVKSDPTVDRFGYSVSAPVSIIRTDKISKLSPVIYAGGKQVSDCKCGQREADMNTRGDTLERGQFFDAHWTDRQCKNVGRLMKDGKRKIKLKDCKDACNRKDDCNAINFCSFGCILRACQEPIPKPKGKKVVCRGHNVKTGKFFKMFWTE